MRTFYIGDDVQLEHMGPDVAILVVGGEVDFEVSPQLKARLMRAIKAGNRRLILDLTDVTFIDSTAIGVLAGTVEKLDELGGGSLSVVSNHEKVVQIFEITGLDNMVTIHASRDEALAAATVTR
ncbi:MAG TPA: STAS domain-containing protein [Solirubrobacteraceae bacterium]|jgi:anti-sigma B factor antagonist|nr:STAS domain-containing protein [Solirubrobacteraceae bacterium]